MPEVDISQATPNRESETASSALVSSPPFLSTPLSLVELIEVEEFTELIGVEELAGLLDAEELAELVDLAGLEELEEKETDLLLSTELELRKLKQLRLKP
ncbi:hypothetical protein MMC31_005148 [Peltigera leucophlebia]|nr:hypothetical protein [Peltigera leucophlebia]